MNIIKIRVLEIDILFVNEGIGAWENVSQMVVSEEVDFLIYSIKGLIKISVNFAAYKSVEILNLAFH